MAPHEADKERMDDHAETGKVFTIKNKDYSPDVPAFVGTEKHEKEKGDELLEYKERPHPHKTKYPESDSQENRGAGEERPSQKH